MSYINKLPTEILQEIFGYLEGDKEDLETCLLVCKLWNSVASGLFWDGVLFCMTSTSRRRQLLNDVSHEHSTLAPKVQHLDYEVYDEEESEKEESDQEESNDDPIATFISIVNMCTNIIQLCLLSGNVHEVLKELMDQQENAMPYVQFLNLQSSANELKKDNISLKSLHVRANYKYPKSITYLLFPQLDGKEDIFKEYGGITKYLLNFPNLDKLECEDVQGVNFDFPLLLEHSTCLKDIELFGECHLTTQTKISNDNQSIPSHSALKHIHFRFEKLCIDTIKYLTQAIENIHVISLLPWFSNRTGQIVGTKDDTAEAFDKFTQQCNNFKCGDNGHEHAHVLFRNGDHVVALGEGNSRFDTTYHDSTDEDEDGIYGDSEQDVEWLEEWEERQMYREMAYEAMLQEEEEEEESHDSEDEDLSDEDDSEYDEDAKLLEKLDLSEREDDVSYEEDNDSDHDELSYEEY